MPHAAISLPLVDEARVIADALVEHGYVWLRDALPDALVAALREDLQARPEMAFAPAGIGRGDEHRLHRGVRRDRILWLDGSSPPQRELLAGLEALRRALNRELFLGLFDIEAHYAWYPPGAFYGRHYDAFAGGDNHRILSCVFYLNHAWPAEAGGELVIYGPARQVLERITPAGGSAVLFLSERFPHEVLPAIRDRYSIAVWFRVNASHAGRVDPAR